MDEEMEMQGMLYDELKDTIENYGTQVTGTKERECEATNVTKLADAYVKIYQAETERVDREERRRIEEEKSKESIELEKSKVVPFWQSCIEWSVKYLLPGCISALFFNKFQKRTLEFEETGTFRSKASKDLRTGWMFWK